MGFSLVPLLLGGLSLCMNAYNTHRTAEKQDDAAADAIRAQGRIQQRGDARVNETVGKLEGSTSSDEKAERQENFMDSLRTNRKRIEGGLVSDIGGDAFQAAQAGAREDVGEYGAENAGLLARIDAPGMQRQGEAFDFGHLGTDIGLLGRESSGQAFMDDLRMRAIRRNPWMDAGSALLGGLAGSGMGAMGGGGGAAPPGIPGGGQGFGQWWGTGRGLKTGGF